MTRWTRFHEKHDRADEPARDESLGALLRGVVGDPIAAGVDWDRLAARIAAALPGHHTTPWWSYAERWQRRAVPLALAAGLVGLFALWDSGSAAARNESAVPSATEMISAVMSGTSAADAARTYTRSLTNTSDISGGVIE
jgi:hypothetical protein